MTRTGLKRVSAENYIMNPSVVSIPLSKARKIDVDGSNQKRTSKKDIEPKTMANGNLTSHTSKKSPKQIDSCSIPDQKVHNNSQKSFSEHLKTQDSISDPSSDQTLALTRTPCACDQGTRNYEEGSGKRLEGTGVLSHGSQLRFGCLQFLLSVAGYPGHDELIICLLDVEDPTYTTQLS